MAKRAAKRSGGRPSSFKPEFIEQAGKLCDRGATDTEIADFFGIAVSTFYKWKHDYPKFSEALKLGKEASDKRVEQSLYHRATGYTRDTVKIFMPAGAKKPVYAPYREHVPPDPTSMIFWLKNRQPDRWRDKSTQELTGADGAPLVPVINITGRPGTEPAPAPEAVDSVRKPRD